MHKNKSKICPRCNSNFNCQPESIHDCACTKIQLQPETLEFLRKTKYACVCPECLKQLDQMVTIASQNPLPRQDLLIENLHYYVENGLLVFTEFYHIQKGHCCKNNCRHCAYGYTIND